MNEEIKEQAQMWVEDERSLDLKFAEIIMNKIRQCPIDFNDEFNFM